MHFGLYTAVAHGCRSLRMWPHSCFQCDLIMQKLETQALQHPILRRGVPEWPWPQLDGVCSSWPEESGRNGAVGLSAGAQ